MTNESKQASINSYYLTLVRLKYEDELRRESSLIQQATQILRMWETAYILPPFFISGGASGQSRTG